MHNINYISGAHKHTYQILKLKFSQNCFGDVRRSHYFSECTFQNVNFCNSEHSNRKNLLFIKLMINFLILFHLFVLLFFFLFFRSLGKIYTIMIHPTNTLEILRYVWNYIQTLKGRGDWSGQQLQLQSSRLQHVLWCVRLWQWTQSIPKFDNFPDSDQLFFLQHWVWLEEICLSTKICSSDREQYWVNNKICVMFYIQHNSCCLFFLNFFFFM